MRYLLLLLTLGKGLFASPQTTMAEIEAGITRQLCKAPCVFKFDSVTQNGQIWGFAFSLHQKVLKGSAEINSFSEALEQTGNHVLEMARDKVAVIGYFRETAGKFARLSGEEFHRSTLNPISKIVVRYAPDFLQSGGHFTFHLPPVWETEGLAPATTLPLTLSIRQAKDPYMSLEILDLNDKPIPALTFAACLNAGKECNTASIPIKADGETRLDLQLKAARKLHTDQPAFKLVLKAAGGSPLVNLAIPFKPQPNYFLFGVTGFLFGGLIAVMMLFMKRKQRPPSAAA